MLSSFKEHMNIQLCSIELYTRWVQFISVYTNFLLNIGVILIKFQNKSSQDCENNNL